MEVFAALITLFATAAMAVPAGLETRDEVCPGGLLSSNPQCCATDVLGVASLDCKSPSRTPSDGKELEQICSEEGGRKAQCCSVPVAGQSLLCNPPVGA